MRIYSYSEFPAIILFYLEDILEHVVALLVIFFTLVKMLCEGGYLWMFQYAITHHKKYV